jgi:ElaB/YqjD/DUF883 family membrane-anchored ribosome-binding protein
VENEPEVIRQQMQETRTALTEKLEALEQQVTGTVQDAREAVTDTVETVRDAVTETVDVVKDSVRETVDTVKETLDLSLQVERHPWAMVGGSVAVGFASGCLFDLAAEEMRHVAARRATFTHRNGGPLRAEPPSAGHSWLGELADKFHDEIGQLKGLAIGVALGVARDMLAQSMPDNLRGQVTEVVDNITTKLGAQPLRGPVLGESRRS